MSALPASARKRILVQSAGIRAGLAWYAADSAMPRHSHDHHQVSFLLAGELQERHATRAKDVLLPGLGIKPSGFAHANRYGPHGALIFSLDIDADLDLHGLALDLSDWCWHAVDGLATTRALRAVLAAIVAPAGEAPDDTLWDLLASLVPATRDLPAIPTPWLRRVREALRDDGDASLSAMAREAGIHPVHLSRAFGATFGCAPSVYRARARLLRAITAMQAGEPAALAAASAGYADQAHFCRQAKALIGITPRQLHGALSPA
jgi:AraC family transcriptional regulator